MPNIADLQSNCRHPERTAYITDAAYLSLLLHGRRSWPEEACGLLIRRGASDGCPAAADAAIALRNAHPAPGRAFAFDPAEWVETFCRIQADGHTVVGWYHTHPRTAPVPSLQDAVGAAGLSGLTCWILSLRRPESPELRAYRVTAGRFDPLMVAQISV